MVEISDRVQFFTSKRTYFHGNLETLAPKGRPQESTEKELSEEPDEEKLYLFLKSEAHAGHALANVPYTLFADGAKLESGISDAKGRIVVPHVAGRTKYRAELGNGEMYDLPVSKEFAQPGTEEFHEQNLSNRGVRSLGASQKSRSKA
jgi:type VI secretion system secreted protein VgrG